MARRCGIFDVYYRQDVAIFRTRLHWISLGVFLLSLIFILPFVIKPGMLSTLTTMAITVVGAVGLNIITGYCGQIHLGQAGFICLGGYISAMLMYHFQFPWLLTLPFSVAGCIVVAIIFGLPSLRIKGFYIAMTTLASYFVITWVFMRGGSITGGPEGIPVALPKIFGLPVDTPVKMYWLVMVITILMVAIAMNIMRTRTGRAFVAIRDNDIVASHMGIDIFRYKMIAFMISAFYAGIAGSMFAVAYGFIYYEQFSFMSNVWYLAYIVIGGMGSIPGAIFGVIFLKLLDYYVVIAGNFLGNIFPTFGGAAAALVGMSFGAVLVIFLIFEPRGLYHRWDNLRSSLRIWPFPY